MNSASDWRSIHVCRNIVHTRTAATTNARVDLIAVQIFGNKSQKEYEGETTCTLHCRCTYLIICRVIVCTASWAWSTTTCCCHTHTETGRCMSVCDIVVAGQCLGCCNNIACFQQPSLVPNWILPQHRYVATPTLLHLDSRGSSAKLCTFANLLLLRRWPEAISISTTK